MRMKKILFSLLVLLGLSACKYDDDALWEKVNSLDNRVTSIEQQLTEMNTNINSVSLIVNALQEKVYVTRVQTVSQGYLVFFSDGSQITINHGRDGLSPYIGTDGNWWIGDTNTGVKAEGQDGSDGQDGVDGQSPYIGTDGNWWIGDTNTGVKAEGQDGSDGQDGVDGQSPYIGMDGNWWIGDTNTGVKAEGTDAPIISIEEYEGRYYWVRIVDGVQDWLTDKLGNRIPVTGDDAVTPLLKVNAVGYWMVSYDNGLNYTEILDQYGNPIKAVGQDGTSGTPWFDDVRYDSVTGVLTIIINGEIIELVTGEPTGIPSDALAGIPPIVEDGSETFVMPTSISPMSLDPENSRIGRFNLAGIQIGTGEWLQLFGTGEENQNVWVEINGVQKGIKVINGEEVQVRSRSASPITKAKADVVFLVDNSGSMSEEANKVAEEIIRWSAKLSQTMDVKFGCVGIDHRYINGALNITDVNTLSEYLNQFNGTNRTQHFGATMSIPPSDMDLLKARAQNYVNAGGECGGIMLHFADENFTFREGANRFYVYFTDEPNQPGGNAPWSVLTVKETSEYYNWNASKGVIYTVYSGKDLYGDPHGWTNWLREEDPCLFSTYTGGQILETTGAFEISLDDLPVTGAITQSFIFTFNITPDLTVGGMYDITIIIYSTDGSVISKYTYENIQLIAS